MDSGALGLAGREEGGWQVTDWRAWGLTAKGGKVADSLLPRMLELASDAKASGANEELLQAVLREACFQIWELPRRKAAGK